MTKPAKKAQQRQRDRAQPQPQKQPWLERWLGHTVPLWICWRRAFTSTWPWRWRIQVSGEMAALALQIGSDKQSAAEYAIWGARWRMIPVATAAGVCCAVVSRPWVGRILRLALLTAWIVAIHVIVA